MEQIGLQGQISGIVNPAIPSGMYIDYDDFVLTPVDAEDYALTQAASEGTWALSSLENGALLMSCGSTSDGKGPQMQRPSASFRPKAGRKIWFETRLCVTGLASDIFIGLAEIDTTVVATSAMTTSNHIGFSSFTGAGLLLSDSNNAAATTTTTGYQLVTATYVTLGFIVDGLDTVKFYANGNFVGQLATAYIPTVALSPSFVLHGTGTGTPTMSIDYWICQQTR